MCITWYASQQVVPRASNVDELFGRVAKLKYNNYSLNYISRTVGNKFHGYRSFFVHGDLYDLWLMLQFLQNFIVCKSVLFSLLVVVHWIFLLVYLSYVIIYIHRRR